MQPKPIYLRQLDEQRKITLDVLARFERGAVTKEAKAVAKELRTAYATKADSVYDLSVIVRRAHNLAFTHNIDMKRKGV